MTVICERYGPEHGRQPGDHDVVVVQDATLIRVIGPPPASSPLRVMQPAGRRCIFPFPMSSMHEAIEIRRTDGVATVRAPTRRARPRHGARAAGGAGGAARSARGTSWCGSATVTFLDSTGLGALVHGVASGLRPGHRVTAPDASPPSGGSSAVTGLDDLLDGS